MSKLVLPALAGLAVLSACANRPPSSPAPSGPLRLFLSPSGQPYRAAPGGDALAAWIAAADTDGDGRLSAAEVKADALRFFAALDTDADGRISGAENSRYEREVAPEIAGGRPRQEEAAPPEGRPERRGPGRGGGDRGLLRGGAGMGVTGEPQPIRAADRDLSQDVSRAEFEAHAQSWFVRLDIGHDDQLTRAELDVALEPAMTAGPGPGRGGPPGGRRR